MCMTCGCGTTSDHEEHPHQHDHHHSHDHGHSHDHHHGMEHNQSDTRLVRVEQELLAKNNAIAEQTRVYLRERNMLALNLVSSPGAGKTTLLEKTLTGLRERYHFVVIEGDQQTDNDALRIEATGAPVLQITTGQVCHLDAQMVQNALFRLDPAKGSIVMIENVGNLVCPAMFDLGEAAKVVVASTTEGADKPAKYPYMFREAGLILLNKIDLLPHLDFNTESFEAMAHAINPEARIIPLSATTGEGMEEWHQWLEERMAVHG